jgi:hypothetical protein
MLGHFSIILLKHQDMKILQCWKAQQTVNRNGSNRRQFKELVPLSKFDSTRPIRRLSMTELINDCLAGVSRKNLMQCQLHHPTNNFLFLRHVTTWASLISLLCDESCLCRLMRIRHRRFPSKSLSFTFKRKLKSRKVARIHTFATTNLLHQQLKLRSF